MADLNNADPTPPEEVKAELERKAQARREHDPQRTNDSEIDPQRPEEDILKGFHGG